MTVIDRNQFNIEQLVARSIEELGGVAPVTVRLNPLDHQLFQRLQQADEVSPQLPAEVEIVSDVNVARGGCITESETISLVTDLETRLASVRQAWLENLDDAQTERRATGRNGWEPGRVPDRRETA
jgi:flagellar biosynthesis/type III secretory pathway protein FliH